MKFMICNIFFQMVMWKEFVFSVGGSRFLFENISQFRIARD